jgi:hypothetical protein
MTVRPFDVAGKLIDQGLHDLQTDARTPQRIVRREADTFIAHRQLDQLILSTQFDADLARAPRRVGVFQRIPH